MSGNDIIVLDSILAQKRADRSDSMSESDYFEIFSFEQALKNYDLSYDELLSGSVDSSNDGGIDGFFIFLNKEFLDEDTDLSSVKRNPLLEIYIIQAKVSPSFTEKAIEALIATIQDLFDLSKSISSIEKFYNPKVIEKTEILHKSYVSLANRHPTLVIKYVYASRGISSNIHSKVINKVDILKQLTEKYFTGASVEFIFLGARELLESSRSEKIYSLQLKFLETYISRGEDNYVVLASLRDYYDFVTDEDKILRKYLFESNVRDYQGDNIEVNRDIRRTLSSDKLDVDFWWLNNGITILASKASVAGKVITLDDVQIVNGLQTTSTIYEYLRPTAPSSDATDHEPSLTKVQDERAILIKIIVTNNLEARDRIIKATNFQTPVLPASLRATEPIQRDIEDYFLQHDWFYDRRKNYYKNVQKPPEKIISIPYLAQAFTAIVHREPHVSKGRPTTIIKGDSSYSRVFNTSIKIEIYLFCAKTLKALESFTRSSSFTQLKDDVNHPYLNITALKGLIFHYAMLFTVKILRKADYRLKDLEAVVESDFDEHIIAQTALEMAELTSEYMNLNGSLSLNTIVKREDFVAYLLQAVNVYPSCIVKLSS